GTLDFNEVMEAVADIFLSTWKPTSLAILVWDHDLETVSEKLFYGADRQLLGEAADEYARVLEHSGTFDDKVVGIFESENPADSELCYVRIQKDGQICAAILMAGAGCPAAEIEKKLDELPFYVAIANAWEIREIKLENERLRSRYDDLEDQNASLEDQTRKMIQDLTVKDALRFRTMERDKLLYEISSAVRSSVEIQQVLQNAVNNLGQKFDLSRCLILRPSSQGDQLFVYEYHNVSEESVQDRFFSPAGQDFVRSIMSKTAPCELGDMEDGQSYGFDIEFLKSFAFLSGLIVPLIMRTRTIGAIFLQDCKMPRPWSIDDLTFFGALADQLSVAVENADLHEEKKLQAVTDGLTGISNRRNFNDCFYKEFERARRYAEPMTLAVFDLDFLKKINDSYGHTAGDDAIKAVASVLSRSSRSIDIAARYGGEEFCLLLPNTLLEESVTIAERIRKLINETEIPGVGNISASIGVANFPLHASDPDDLFKRADEALYKAKEQGRNRVCVYDSEQK
ncbi:MAG: sensor domain-containing diguanylate cyclase, partial [Candidatus Obscuribacterales bacterium]|nr:sensor domain-containing diguanylate cyclase [Candidatus Obscuribacterales bacterium]